MNRLPPVIVESVSTACERLFFIPVVEACVDPEEYEGQPVICSTVVFQGQVHGWLQIGLPETTADELVRLANPGICTCLGHTQMSSSDLVGELANIAAGVVVRKMGLSYRQARFKPPVTRTVSDIAARLTLGSTWGTLALEESAFFVAADLEGI